MPNRSKEIAAPSGSIRYLILPIYIPSILMSIGMGMTMLVIPLLAMDLTDSYSLSSVIFAMLGVGTLLSDVPAGLLVSRFGIKPALLIGVALASITVVLAGVFESTVVLGAAGLAYGAGRGINMLARMTYIADSATSQRGRAMATVGGTMRIGSLIGPVLGGFLSKYTGYKVTLVTAGLIMAASLFFLPFIESFKRPSLEKPTGRSSSSVLTILRENRSVFLTAGTAIIGLQLLRSARLLIVPLWGKHIGLDAADIGLITGIPMAFEMTLFYPVGLIMDKFGRKWTSVPCMVLLSLGILLIPVSHTFTSFFAIAMLASLGNGLGSGIVLTLGADFSPENRRSDFLGLWRLSGDIGQTSSPFIIGFVTQAATLSIATRSIGTLGMMGAMVMLFLVKESRSLQ